MNEMRPIAAAATLVAGAAAFIAFLVVLEVVDSVQRSCEKRTMHTIVQWSVTVERGLAQPPVIHEAAERWRRLRIAMSSSNLERVDAWGTRLAIHVTASGYEIRSAAADRRFDEVVLQGEKTAFQKDLVLANGSFVQFPAGSIALPDSFVRLPKPPTVPLLIRCNECHGDRLQR